MFYQIDKIMDKHIEDMVSDIQSLPEVSLNTLDILSQLKAKINSVYYSSATKETPNG